MRTSILPTLLSALLTLAPPGGAAAQTVAFGGVKADTRAPVEITADQLSVDQSSGQASFTGNVLIGQGQMRLKADKVTVSYASGGRQKIRSLHATGNVTLVSGPDAAEAGEAVYDVESGQVTLKGNALVSQGKSVMAGDEVRVNLADGTAQVNGRVRTVLQPGGN